jgi:hypothetical protein
VGQAAEVAYDGYVKLLSALTSKESLEVSASAEAMMDAARDDDADTYAKAAAAHEESLRKLPSAELEDVYEYLKVPKP